MSCVDTVAGTPEASWIWWLSLDLFFVSGDLLVHTHWCFGLSEHTVSPLREQAVFLIPFLVFTESPTVLNTQLLLCFRFPQPLHPPCSAFVPSGSEPHSPVTCSLERLMSVKALSSRSWMRVFPETKQTLLRPPEPHRWGWALLTVTPGSGLWLHAPFQMVPHLYWGASGGEDTWQRPQVW